MLPEFLQLVENLLNYNLYLKRENLDRTIMHEYRMLFVYIYMILKL